jgi:hypothetical protein
MKIVTIYILSSILLILGCSAVNRKTIPDGPVQYSVILSGTHSGASDYQVKLITNQKEWENIWQTAMGGEEPLPNITTIDFGHQYVIAAFMGQRRSSGYKIEISSIEKQGPVLKVTVKKYETPGMLTIITNPFTLVRVPRGNYKLEVSEESVQ